MKRLRVFAPIAALLVLASCQKEAAPPIDAALRNDLALASQMQPYQPQMYVSPQEAGYGYGTAPGYYPQPQYAPRPQQVVYRQAPQVIRRAPAPVSRSEAGVYASESRVVKHTKRDAIIGAAAGAAIGAVSTRNRVKGAVIGAAAGGLIGAIIGEKVDVTRPR
ncbi:MAG: YMGG-like glycine zipper-containing protein [Gemmatimonadaceae bacterium]